MLLQLLRKMVAQAWCSLCPCGTVCSLLVCSHSRGAFKDGNVWRSLLGRTPLVRGNIRSSGVSYWPAPPLFPFPSHSHPGLWLLCPPLLPFSGHHPSLSRSLPASSVNCSLIVVACFSHCMLVFVSLSH